MSELIDSRAIVPIATFDDAKDSSFGVQKLRNSSENQ